MFKQVGEEMLPAYYWQAWELLRPGGIFLNQGISASPFQLGRTLVAFSPCWLWVCVAVPMSRRAEAAVR
jgi:cyclopropane-fatty-acyl-phospholipid synthase